MKTNKIWTKSGNYVMSQSLASGKNTEYNAVFVEIFTIISMVAENYSNRR